MNKQAKSRILEERRILIGITGSIAVYKAVDLASKLTQAGARVEVILTEAAQQFVRPLTFQSVTGLRAYTDVDLWGSEAHVLHIGLAESADLLVIAPATANTIAKLAHGQADSLLTVTALAARCPLLLAPAMDSGMFEHPATQDNLKTLEERGVVVVGPVEGRMASGLIGKGRMVEPAELMGHIRWVLGREGSLAGRKVLVTAGGTHEPIDPVRVVANRSSGKQGFALAQASLDRGAEVTLITGPVHLATPVGARRLDVTTANEMRDAVLSEVEGSDVLLMAAAVADFRPTKVVESKIKRRKGPPEVQLEPTDDILGLVASHREKTDHPTVVVGFAAESQDMVENAQVKLEEKKLDLIVANDITASDSGFAVDTNRVTLINAQGAVEKLPLMSKAEVAEEIMERVVALLGKEG
ncbi:MAG TPA: bifunctional phosphopantothenoylcysteine decarboxylase/phosphopantothenate--cysteine ligase CoaBC [Anaerolineae bacterium]|nr:bifunctional phosphopantothenoylcysteine decarboxylase/phosphopantothenate--cysteine ligase CoaBC [Anaerolineae bacterium]